MYVIVATPPHTAPREPKVVMVKKRGKGYYKKEGTWIPAKRDEMAASLAAAERVTGPWHCSRTSADTQRGRNVAPFALHTHVHANTHTQTHAHTNIHTHTRVGAHRYPTGPKYRLLCLGVLRV